MDWFLVSILLVIVLTWFTLRVRPKRKKPRHSPEYTAYINSPQWKETRKRIMVRAGNRCERRTWGVRCRNRAVQVHHKTYVRLGHERDSDLMAACLGCHKILDKEREKRR